MMSCRSGIEPGTVTRWTKAAALLCALAFGRDARAQNTVLLRIIVAETGGQATIPNVVVSLVSPSGDVIGRGLTGLTGIVMVATSPGPLRVRARRIGYLSVDVSLPDSARAAGELRITLQSVARVLPPIVTTDAARCASDGSRPRALALWEQARSALLASEVARSNLPTRGEVLLFRHGVSIEDRPLQMSVVRLTPSGTARPFAAARSATDFAKLGYTEGPAKQPTLLAPDEGVLFSDEFLDTHCFAIKRGDAGDQSTVQITFSPTIDRRDMVDIEGTVTMRREPLDLLSIEFLYVGLPKAHREARSGGGLWFATMPSGYPLVQRWRIRSAGNTPTGMLKFDYMPEWMRMLDDRGVIEMGAEIGRLEWADGATWESSRLASVRGSVREGGVGQGNTTARSVAEGTRDAVPGALVQLEGAPYQTHTSNDGRFQIDAVLPGLYMLSARDTLLARFGLERMSRSWISISPDDSSPNEVLIIPRDTFLERRCRESSYRWPRGNGDGVILGRILTADGTSLRGTFEARPSGMTGDTWKPIVGSVIDGYFRVCRAPTSAIEFTVTTQTGSVRYVSESAKGLRFVSIIVP